MARSAKAFSAALFCVARAIATAALVVAAVIFRAALAGTDVRG